MGRARRASHKKVRRSGVNRAIYRDDNHRVCYVANGRWVPQRNVGVPQDKLSCRHDRWVSTGAPTTLEHAKERMHGAVGRG
jgi:hypothetical protein